MAKLKLLGVLLCYNDADILEDNILHLLENNHDLVVWDHGSDDGTASILDKYQGELAERRVIPRSFDFYNLYQAMSEHLLADYTGQYDWLSWPDQDELLEGADRSKTYSEWIEKVAEEGYDFVQFNNFNFWFTAADDGRIESPVERVRHYGLFPDCAPRIRSWRAAKTNLRIFNHNPIEGLKLPYFFNLRHYPMRTPEQMLRRLNKDRADLERNGANYHYNNMSIAMEQKRLIIDPELLHIDNGISELDPTVKYNWRDIYGHGSSKSS
jgi:glycosyltransferase involved in cell wall biosynthesis